MEKSEWEELSKLSDRELFDFVTEKDSSQRKHAALHLLEMRRGRVMQRVAMWSAIAAFLSAIVAVAQLLK